MSISNNGEKTLQPIYNIPIIFCKSLMPSSFTQYCWIKLALIVQDSSLQALSLGLVSVPMWLIIFSDQLSIIGLVQLLPHQLPNTAKAHL